jgi:hypothetical protein
LAARAGLGFFSGLAVTVGLVSLIVTLEVMGIAGQTNVQYTSKIFYPRPERFANL